MCVCMDRIEVLPYPPCACLKAHEPKGKFFNQLKKKSIHEYVITLLTGTLIIGPSAGHLSDRKPSLWSEGLEVLVGDQWGAVQ